MDIPEIELVEFFEVFKRTQLGKRLKELAYSGKLTFHFRTGTITEKCIDATYNIA